jgi:hypothetical protein
MWSDGSVVGDCSIAGWGEMGRWWRHRIRSWTPKELRDWTTERLNRNLRGASLKNVVTADDRETGRCGLSIEFSGPGFAQMMSGGLAIVRLDLLSHDTIPAFAQPTRVTPLEIRPLVERDQVTLTLPTNFKIEELPAKVTVDSAYGTYERSYSMKDDRLVSERLVKLRRVVVPPTDYPAFRKFLSDLAKADRSAVVLRRGI